MIKFRAWDKNQQIMRGVRGLFWTKNKLVAHCSPMGNKFDKFFTTILNDGEYHLMQSTGLFDKNGVEIFEGDVVNAYDYDYDEGKIYKTTDLTGVITYDKNAFCIQSGKILTDLWVHAEEIEIIENIYQNHDLLESVEE